MARILMKPEAMARILMKPEAMARILMKLFPVCAFCPGLKSIPLRVYSTTHLTTLSTFNQNLVCSKEQVTNRHKIDLDPVNRIHTFHCKLNSGSYVGVPINRETVYRHRVGEFSPCPVRLYSTVSPEGRDMAWEKLVDFSRLSPLERKIHEHHKRAVMENQSFYTDPLTGYHVMTRHAHLQRGECCGNACRHCPYQHRRVADDANKMIFNTAFYVGNGELEDT